MSEFKGTQGKWVISGTSRDFCGNTGYFLSSKVKISEVEANALLISKAPEMLEELKETVVDLKILRNQIDFEARNGNSRFDGMDFLLDKWIERKEKLIKEATEL